MSSTCEAFNPLTYIGPFEICGGHGQCSPAGVCICDEKNFWFPTSDFIDLSGKDCPTNSIGIRVLWAINTLEVLAVVSICLPVMYARISVFLEQRRLNNEYTLMKNRGLLAVILMYFITMPCQFAMSILKLIDPERHVGFDILTTILFFLAKAGFYLGITAYQPALLRTMLQGTRGVDGFLRIYTVVVSTVQAGAFIAGALPFVTLGYPNDLDIQIIIMRVYYFVHGSCLFGNALAGWFVWGKIERVLDASASLQADKKQARKMEKLKGKLTTVQKTTVIQGTLQGCVFMIMFFIPFMWTKHDYLLPASWITMPIIVKQAAFAVNMDSYQSKTLLDRFMPKTKDTKTSGHGMSEKEDVKGSSFQALAKSEHVKSSVAGGTVRPGNAGIDTAVSFAMNNPVAEVEADEGDYKEASIREKSNATTQTNNNDNRISLGLSRPINPRDSVESNATSREPVAMLAPLSP